MPPPSNVTVRALMGGQWRDLSRWAQTVQLSVGYRAPNAVGSVASGSLGVVQFQASDGVMNPFTPGDGIDPLPGVEVEAYAGTTLIFRGWSNGLQMQLPPTSQQISTMPLLGPLRYLSDRQPRIFTTLSANLGQIRTDQLVDVVLDELRWPSDRRRLDVGQTTLIPYRVRTSGLLGRSRRLVEFRPALTAIAQAEVGRIYDDRFGNIVFENRLRRSTRTFRRADYLLSDASPGVSVRSVETRPLAESIINTVEGQTRGFVSLSNRDLQFVESNWNTPFTVEAGREETLFLNIDLDGMSAVYVQSYQPIVAGTHYTLTGSDAAVVSMQPSDTSVEITVDNRSGSSSATLTLLKIEGEPFGEAPGRGITYRNLASIARYGERLYTLPNDLVKDLEELREHLRWVGVRHGGVAEDGSADLEPFRALDVECLLSPGDNLAAAQPSHLIALTVGDLGLNRAPFYIDEVTHRVNADGAHRVTLRVQDARAWLMWAGARFRIGFTTNIAF